MIQKGDLVQAMTAALTEAQGMYGQGLQSISQEDLMILLDIIAAGIIEAFKKTHPEAWTGVVPPQGGR
jgi:hypothetical protein